MKVFNLFNGQDTAGIGYRLARAFAEHGGRNWHLDSMCATANYIDYPVDVPWGKVELERLYDEADVVMIHHFLFAHDSYDAGQGKPTVLMHHGLKNGTVDTFAATVKECSEQGITQICSTLDMQIWTDGLAKWVPPPYDLAWLRELRKQYYWPQNGGVRPAGAPLRIVHAPTNREIKGTDILIDALTAARVGAGANYELVLLERLTWAETLLKIATADIAFDQPVLGYGCFAVECMAMGLPVIAGVVDEQVREGMRSEWGVLPFFQVEPTIGSIAGALAQFEDPFGRQLYAGLGTAHVDRYHDAAKVVARLKPILASAGPTIPGGWNRRITRPGGEPLHPIRARQPIRGRQVNRVRR